MSGLVLGASGLVLGASGLGLGASGLVLGASGLVLGVVGLVLGASGLFGQSAIPRVVNNDQGNATALLQNTMGRNAVAKPAMNSHATETLLAKVLDK